MNYDLCQMRRRTPLNRLTADYNVVHWYFVSFIGA